MPKLQPQRGLASVDLIELVLCGPFNIVQSREFLSGPDGASCYATEQARRDAWHQDGAEFLANLRAMGFTLPTWGRQRYGEPLEKVK